MVKTISSRADVDFLLKSTCDRFDDTKFDKAELQGHDLFLSPTTIVIQATTLMTTLFIDNYDSFSYNIVQYLQMLGADGTYALLLGRYAFQVISNHLIMPPLYHSA